jgi:hypothetical protein
MPVFKSCTKNGLSNLRLNYTWSENFGAKMCVGDFSRNQPCQGGVGVQDIKDCTCSVICTATGYLPDDRGVGFRVPLGSRIFTSPRRPDRLSGPTQPPNQCVPRAISSGVKRPGCEADQSSPTSAEVKKIWIYTSTPPIRLHGVVLN